MVSQDMDIRICRFRQEQALLSILPLCSLNGLIEDVEGWDEYVQYAVNKMSGQPCNNQ